MSFFAIASYENMRFGKPLRINVFPSTSYLVTQFYFLLNQIILLNQKSLLNWTIFQMSLVILPYTLCFKPLYHICIAI